MAPEYSTTTPTRRMPEKLYGYVITAGAGFSHVFLLAIRLVWGREFFLTGKGKLANLDRTAGFFQELHIPAPKLNAIMASSTETFGGALLLVGLASRLVSVPLAITMTVAYLTAHRENVHSIDDFVSQAPFPFLFTALVVFCFGPGIFSVDGVIRYIRAKKDPALFKE